MWIFWGKEGEKEREGERRPDEDDDTAAAFAYAIAVVIATPIAADVRCCRRRCYCCCLQMLLLLHHVVDDDAAIIAFPSKFRAQLSWHLQQLYIYLLTSRHCESPFDLAIAVATSIWYPQKTTVVALRFSGVRPQKISAFGKIYPNIESLGDSIALGAASQRVPLIFR